MAIGDAVTVFLGTATVNRQPAAGVEEQITAIVKPGVADGINIYDGTTARLIIAGALQTLGPNDVGAGDFSATPHNLAIIIDNSHYLRKTGTTDRVHISGVQTNS